MKNTCIALAAVVLLAGCVTQKNWSATGGSRADATVKMSYEYNEFEKPELDDAEAQRMAEARCKTWGYTGAEAFGGVTRQCNMPGGFGGGCGGWLVTKEFQCTGRGDAGGESDD